MLRGRGFFYALSMSIPKAGGTMLPPLPPTRPNSASARTFGVCVTFGFSSKGTPQKGVPPCWNTSWNSSWISMGQGESLERGQERVLQDSNELHNFARHGARGSGAWMGHGARGCAAKSCASFVELVAGVAAVCTAPESRGHVGDVRCKQMKPRNAGRNTGCTGCMLQSQLRRLIKHEDSR